MKGTITRRGKNSWQLKYDLPRDPETGKRRFAYATVRGKRAEAQKELRRRLTALDKGVHVDPSGLTLAAYLAGYLREVAPDTVALKSLERYAGLVRNQINPHLGNIPLQKLRPADVSAWLKTLGKTDISIRSIRHAHGVLRTALNYAAAVELVERNVASLIRPPALPDTKVEMLRANDIADALAKLEGLSIYPVAAIALGTGARRGEIAGLQWSDIDLDAATMRIERSIEQTKGGLRVKPPKTKAGRRTITLPAFVVAVLRDHRRGVLEFRLALGAGALPGDAPVFGDIEGNWPNPSSMSDRWRDAVKNRKLPKVTLHSLRHTHASALIAADLDVVSISRRLGHKSPALTLSVYSHFFKNKDSAAAAALDAAIAES
jgi:integrase